MIRRAFSAIVLLYLLGYAIFAVALPRPAGGQATDAIVVLTGGAKRIERGLDLMAQGKAKRMLVSGVARTVRAEELAAQYQADEALFRCCVDLGSESVDTRSTQRRFPLVKKHRFRSMRSSHRLAHARARSAFRSSAAKSVVGDAVRAIELRPALHRIINIFRARRSRRDMRRRTLLL